MTRLYIPTSLRVAARWYAEGAVPASVAVLIAPEESEDGEYAALMEAAEASRADPDGDGRRVVLVVEGAEGTELAWTRVRALHVDLQPGADIDEGLAWYATQEIPHLIGPI